MISASCPARAIFSAVAERRLRSLWSFSVCVTSMFDACAVSMRLWSSSSCLLQARICGMSLTIFMLSCSPLFMLAANCVRPDEFSLSDCESLTGSMPSVWKTSLLSFICFVSFSSSSEIEQSVFDKRTAFGSDGGVIDFVAVFIFFNVSSDCLAPFLDALRALFMLRSSC